MTNLIYTSIISIIETHLGPFYQDIVGNKRGFCIAYHKYRCTLVILIIVSIIKFELTKLQSSCLGLDTTVFAETA